MVGDQRVEPQLFLPRIQAQFKDAPSELRVQRVVCLTSRFIAWQDGEGAIHYNYFGGPIDTNPNVVVISTTDLREYAHEAKLDFPKALLRVALGQLIIAERNWGLSYHQKTHGCLFDFCERRHDLVAGLRAQAFDHESCRSRIKDTELLESVDALMAL